MTKRRTILNTIAILTFSGVLMAQMDMPASTPGNKSTASSAAPGTLTGIVSDSMCGACTGPPRWAGVILFTGEDIQELKAEESNRES